MDEALPDAGPHDDPRGAAGGRMWRRILMALSPIAAVVLLVALALTVFLPRLIQPAFPVPSGWHDVTPPTPEAITSYAVSPDVPGLILACIGSKAGNLSASPMGPAHLWRTRDGGASWEQLPMGGLTAGCEIAGVRGEPGVFFVTDVYLAQPGLWVTHDAGDHWSQVAVAGAQPQQEASVIFSFLRDGIYRDGKVYTVGSLETGTPGGGQVFSSSADDGHTWTTVEVSPDLLLRYDYNILGFAADYRAAGAWFRLLGDDIPPSSGTAARPSLIIEHSTDDGRTWSVIGRHDLGAEVDAGSIVTIATTPSQPLRLCVAVSVQVSLQATVAAPRTPNGGRAVVRVGPPPPQPRDVALLASDDGGATWRGGTVAQYRREYGGPVWHGVAMSLKGDCFLATTLVRFTVDDTTTIWRLAPGAGSAPQAVEQLHGILLGYFALGRATSGSGERFVGVADKAGPLQVVTCYDPAPCVDPTPAPPHLIWTDAS